MAVSAVCGTCLSLWREQVEREKVLMVGRVFGTHCRVVSRSSVSMGIFSGRGNVMAADDLRGCAGYAVFSGRGNMMATDDLRGCAGCTVPDLGFTVEPNVTDAPSSPTLC